MSFSPGQFITAQRLNRLQRKSYWSVASGSFTSTSIADIPGTSMSIQVDTDGATADFWWTTDGRAGASAPTAVATVQAFWDVNGSPVYNVWSVRTALSQASTASNWSTTITNAGTYTFKLRGTMQTNISLNIYTSLLVHISEVA
jgi:hypothetical protein